MNNGDQLNHPHPSQGNAFMLYLLLFNIVLTLGISFAYLSLAQTPYAAFFFTPWFSIINQVFSFLVPLGLWLFYTRDRIHRHLPSMKLGRINRVLILSLCLCLQPAMMLFSALTSLIFPNAAAEALSGMQAYPFVVKLAVIAVTPAFCEELIFRGYLLSQYTGQQPTSYNPAHTALGSGQPSGPSSESASRVKTAAFINGLFFGMMHLNAQQFLYAFVMGVIFAFFVYYTRSVKAGILAHFFVNALQLTLDHFLTASAGLAESSAANDTAYAGSEWSAALYLGIISLVFLPPVLILLRTFITHNRQRNTLYNIHQALKPTETMAETDILTIGAITENAAQNKKTPREHKRERVFDPLFWGVVAIYVLFMLLLEL